MRLLVDPPPPGFPEGYGVGPDPTGFIPLRHRDGSTVDAVVTAHPLFGPDRRALGHVMTVQRWGRRPVIADRAFEQCPFALGVYDPELQFLWVNASACRVMAHSEEQVLGEKYRELFPELDDKANTDLGAPGARVLPDVAGHVLQGTVVEGPVRDVRRASVVVAHRAKARVAVDPVVGVQCRAARAP
ncbi:PAS domain-containing protein [Streptomyces sp. NPDC002888]|uniref:PAS domain-containing protein n=1 Tax=Streptomyces sp. NPDC002888 TaxID=3364668 RepID=UPI0036CAE1AD